MLAAVAAVLSSLLTALAAVLVAHLQTRRRVAALPVPAHDAPLVGDGVPRVLLVEDDAGSAALIRAVLTDGNGLAVDHVEAAEEAAALRRHAVIVLDLRFPGDDRRSWLDPALRPAALARLRARIHAIVPAVVVYTASDDDVLDAIRRTGMADEVLGKRGSLRPLEETIARLLVPRG